MTTVGTLNLNKIQNRMKAVAAATLWLFAAFITVESVDIASSSSNDWIDPKSHFGGVDNDTYLAWVDDNMGPTKTYNVSAYFAAQSSDPLQGAALYWKIDDNTDYVQVAFAARAENGWIGFGIAEAGGMKGSDIVYYESAHPDVLVDAHATEKALPTTDDCQDWTLVNVVNSGGFLIVEAMRKLDTLDANDYAIIHDADPIIAAQRVVLAWGDGDVDAKDGRIAFHGTKYARGGIRWYGDGDEIASFRRLMAATAIGYFDVAPRNYTLRAVETDYVDFCFSWSDFYDQGVPNATGTTVSIIGAEMILDDIGGKFVHHATISGSIKPSNESLQCDLDFEDYSYPLYGWAPGTMPFVMPPDVGFTLGPGADGNGIQSFRINMHYHNPELIAGATDSGGLRVYYVTEPLKHEMGILFLADVFTHLSGHPLGDGLSEFRFDCSGDCSRFALLDDEPVTVIHEYFHMHLKGAGALQQQVRNGQVIRQARTNYFDFDQSGIHAVRQPSFQIMPGDSFVTSCFYQNADVNTTVFGIGSADEMCEGLFLYYPAKRVLGGYPWGCVYDVPVEICNATVTYNLMPPNATSSFRTFGMANAGAASDALAFSSDGSEDALQPPLQDQQTQNQQCLERPAVPTVQGGESTSGAAAYQCFALTKAAWILLMGALVGVGAFFS